MKVYVGNLPFSCTEQELKECFGKYGLVSSCKIITDQETGRSRGFAFVEFGNDNDARQAISELNGKAISEGGRPLVVNEARPREPRGERNSRRYN